MPPAQKLEGIRPGGGGQIAILATGLFRELKSKANGLRSFRFRGLQE